MNDLFRGNLVCISEWNAYWLKNSFLWIFFMVVLAAMGCPVQAAPFAYLGDSSQDKVSVVDLANYETIKSLPLKSAKLGIAEIVANERSGKVYVVLSSVIKIIDATTHTLTGEISLSLPSPGGVLKTAVVSPDGLKIYALTSGGRVIVIDAVKKSMVSNVALDNFAVAMAIDGKSGKLYIATHDALGNSAIAVVGVTGNAILQVVNINDFRATALLVNPGTGRLSILGSDKSAMGSHGYRIVDLVNSTVKKIALTPWPEKFKITNLSSLAFNRDGSRIYIGTYSGDSVSGSGPKFPVLEADSETGAIGRVLLVPAGSADVHVPLKLATGTVRKHLILGIFLSEHLYQYSVEPPRRAVFLDVQDNAVVKEFSFTQRGDGDALTGDIFDTDSETDQSGYSIFKTWLKMLNDFLQKIFRYG